MVLSVGGGEGGYKGGYKGGRDTVPQSVHESVLAKLRRINQILETRMHPVSQTQPELVFKNTTPLPGGVWLKENVWEFDTVDFLGIT